MVRNSQVRAGQRLNDVNWLAVSVNSCLVRSLPIAQVTRVSWLLGFCLSMGFWCGHRTVDACQQPAQVPPQPSRQLDAEHGFRILVWQYKTEAMKDEAQYRSVNLAAWHIDRGQGKQHFADWSKKREWPYYVDHAAGKGILHLTPNSGLNEVPKDGSPSPRPWSFFDDATLTELKARLDRNLPDVSEGPVLAIALDDEVSLGTFNSPLELDFSSNAVAAYSDWLARRSKASGSVERDSSDSGKSPLTFEGVRGQMVESPPSEWRLNDWIDFRHFMDETQSNVFAELTRYANRIAPGVPVGIVGGQQPSVYGGFDYSLLRHCVQWMEAYDIGGTNEILRSFWGDAPRRGQMQTYFASGNVVRDRWFLWYYLAHGCRSVIAWPEIQGRPWFENGDVHPKIEQLSQTFEQVQRKELQVLTHPDTEPLFSPIAILYSHPSVQVGWAIDATAHGKTWPRRSSSLDNRCLSSGKNRVAWTRLLEDLGYQARFVDTEELKQGELQRRGIELLILPQAFALSRTECQAITKFVHAGGHVVADYGAAVVDERGIGYSESPLDDVFGVDRSTDTGWFDGRRRYEINGEQYQRPLIERLPQDGVLKDGPFVVAERCLKTTRLSHQYGRGTSLFLNTSPTAYVDASQRAGDWGQAWRDLIRRKLLDMQIEPQLAYERLDGIDHGVELLRYQASDDREIWVFVSNPVQQASVDGPGQLPRIEGGTVEVKFQKGLDVVALRDLRTGADVESPVTLKLDEAVVLEVIRDTP